MSDLVSNSDNARRDPSTFAGSINRAIGELLEDPDVLVCGQMVKYGVAGLTTGLYEDHKSQFVTYSVSESLMNSSAMGLAGMAASSDFLVFTNSWPFSRT